MAIFLLQERSIPRVEGDSEGGKRSRENGQYRSAARSAARDLTSAVSANGLVRDLNFHSWLPSLIRYLNIHFQGVYCRIPAHFLNRYITRIHWYIFTSDHSSSMGINTVPVEQFCIFAVVQMVNDTGFSAESTDTCFVDGVSFQSCADPVVVAMHGSSSEP